jgi:hypothetical protein
MNRKLRNWLLEYKEVIAVIVIVTVPIWAIPAAFIILYNAVVEEVERRL